MEVMLQFNGSQKQHIQICPLIQFGKPLLNAFLAQTKDTANHLKLES